MGQVNVTLNGRTYRLSCGDGEEPRLLKLVAHVRGHVEQLVQEHGQIGDERLLFMASLLITDELFELRAAVGEPETPPESRLPETRPAEKPPQALAARLPLPRIPGLPGGTPRMQPVPASAGPAPTPASETPEVVRSAGPSAPSAAIAPPAPAPAAAAAVATPAARSVEFLDATALMKGLEKKVSRT